MTEYCGLIKGDLSCDGRSAHLIRAGGDVLAVTFHGGSRDGVPRAHSIVHREPGLGGLRHRLQVVTVVIETGNGPPRVSVEVAVACLVASGHQMHRLFI